MSLWDDPRNNRHGDEIVCPYCGHEHTDSWEWARGEEGLHEGYTCHTCESVFSFERHVTVTYTTRKELP